MPLIIGFMFAAVIAVYSMYSGNLAWIGLQDRVVDDDWKWNSGTPVNYRNFLLGRYNKCSFEPKTILGGIKNYFFRDRF